MTGAGRRPARWRGAGDSFHTQLVAVSASVTALVVIALTILVQLVLAQSTNRSVDRVLVDRSATVVAALTLDPQGRPQVPADELDAGVAVYDDTGTLVAGSVPDADRDTYADLSHSPRPRNVSPSDTDTIRLRAQPFTLRAGAGPPVRGVVVLTERMAPYERSEMLALWVSVGAGVLMILLASALTWWVARRALAPVAAMTLTADDWSEHDLGQRFDLGPGRGEIAGLGRTLDRLLDRVAAAIRSEQRLTAEVAHELRTPLAAVQANADLALLDDDLTPHLRESLDEIAQAARRMAAAIDDLLDLARSAAGHGAPESCVLLDAVRDALDVTDLTTATVAVDPALRVLLPAPLVVRALAPVLDNARRLAASRVEVSAHVIRSGQVALYVDDDGPGVPPTAREEIFEPGRTGGTGAGLGLPLARRIARSMGGDVLLADGPLSTRVVLTLPAA
ncbi:HAMP domain-containing sensor histidine kinase [Nocardioides ginsengisoli]|uniref:histidine kinase n=1 Tax=Nocardioides ginsengisoli TaxID=363868 RepID=A0ABW3W3K8_9ACTN